MTRRILPLLLTSAIVVASCSSPVPPPPQPPPAPKPASLLPSDSQAIDDQIRTLEDKAKADPKDVSSRNDLVGYYLLRMRETGRLDDLASAARVSKESLAAVPAEQNVGGLRSQVLVESASHHYADAHDHALVLQKADPSALISLLLVCDAQLEVGDYPGAQASVVEIGKRGSESANAALNAQTRLARVSFLSGKLDESLSRFGQAVDAARTIQPPPREAVAWSYWQLGEVAFLTGHYDDAQQHYTDALTTFPDYYRALASLGRVLAAKGDLNGAIEKYELVTKRVTDPAYIAALGDLYSLAGRSADAAAQYALVEKAATSSDLARSVYGRTLALYWADHDLNAAQAYALATKEYQTRRDIYGADAVAWTAFKAGKIPEAKAAIQEALRLGTVDVRLLYHAGLIAKKAGDADVAKTFLSKVLDLSPQFDPYQAKQVKAALGQ